MCLRQPHQKSSLKKNKSSKSRASEYYGEKSHLYPEQLPDSNSTTSSLYPQNSPSDTNSHSLTHNLKYSHHNSNQDHNNKKNSLPSSAQKFIANLGVEELVSMFQREPQFLQSAELALNRFSGYEKPWLRPAQVIEKKIIHLRGELALLQNRLFKCVTFQNYFFFLIVCLFVFVTLLPKIL